MNLQMIGIDFENACIEQREPFSFVKGKILHMLPAIALKQDVLSCALLSTCNRTELYLHTSYPVDALQLLTDAAHVNMKTYQSLCTCRQGDAVVRHLFEVAAGLKSQILGDDQIVTQVRTALELAREAKTTDGVLDTLLRHAVTAGKRVKTETRLNNVSPSAAARGVQMAAQHFGSLAGKRVVVIGNGEMGRLSAVLLRDAGCEVTITLRSYRHGETIVPAGCKTYPYENRYTSIDGADLVFSATTSPHYTLTNEQVSSLSAPPALMVDLALPRDIDKNIAENPNIIIWNMDDLASDVDEADEEREHALEVVRQACTDFGAWHGYREALPMIAQLKDTAAERVHFDHSYQGLAEDNDIDGMIELAVNKTIDMMLGGMKDIVSTERLSGCVQHMRKGLSK